MYLKPVITEKSLKLVETLNEYTFEVEKTAAKNELKERIEKTFGVKVKRIRTKIMRAQKKRSGKRGFSSQGSDKKQAIIKLDKKDKISLFEIKKN